MSENHFDPKVSLDERITVEERLRELRRRMVGRRVEAQAQEDLRRRLFAAEEDFVAAEKDARERLPTPRPTNIEQAIANDPVVVARRQALDRLRKEIAPTALYALQAQVEMLTADGNGEAVDPTPSAKVGRKPRQRSTSEPAVHAAEEPSSRGKDTL